MAISMEKVFAEVDDYFEKRSPVHRAAAELAERLRDLDIPFAIVGALAVNAHGHFRGTRDVAVLLTPEGLAAFKARWLGLGWLEVFPGSKGVRSTVHNVRVDVLLAGDYPGDGQPKPVVFPDPADVAESSRDGWPVVPLSTLIELKLASGMSAPHRLQDLADVMTLIRVNELPESYTQHIDPYVRSKYLELWRAARHMDVDY